MVLKIIKYIEHKIDQFFEKSPMDYNKRESILFIVLFVTIIIGSIIMFYFISFFIFKITVVYFVLSFVLTLKMCDIDNKPIIKLICTYLLPYIFLLIFMDNIFSKFLPYRGENLILIRKYKLRTIKRKVYVKKITFWKKWII